MKDKLLNLAYFAFIYALYIFLKIHSPEEEIFEIISFSYPLFLELVDRFTFIMAMKGWGRLF